MEDCCGIIEESTSYNENVEFYDENHLFYSKCLSEEGCSTNSEDESGFTNENVDEESFIHENLSIYVSQKEAFQDIVDDRIDDNLIVDPLDVSNRYCYNELAAPNFHEYQVAHVLPFFEKHYEMKIFECQDSEFFYDTPIYDNYPDDVKYNFIPTSIDLNHSQPIFDT